MLMSNFLKDRKSTREYKSKPVDENVLNELMEYAKNLELKFGVNNFKLYLQKEGSKIYEALKGKGGYAGVMINSPHYISLEILNESEETIIYSAYAFESLITKATHLGLGACWVSIKSVDDDTKSKILNTNNKVNYLLAIGYPIAKNPFEKEATSCRLSIEEIVYKEELGKDIDLDEIEHRGLSDLFYYIRFAPSSYNNQPWRFVLKDDRVILTLLCNEGKFNLTDAGIIMYYFENMAKAIGIDGKWNILNKEDVKVNNNTYKTIGEFML